MAEPLTVKFETKNFQRWTEDLVKGLEKNAAKKALRAVAFEFLKRVIRRTPVDTGRARAGWFSYLIAHGQPLGGFVGRSNIAIAEGIAAGSFEERFSGSEQFIEIINGVKYIVFLEFGHSAQAPAGMMRLTFRELQAGKTMSKQAFAALSEEIAATNRKHRAR